MKPQLRPRCKYLCEMEFFEMPVELLEVHGIGVWIPEMALQKTLKLEFVFVFNFAFWFQFRRKAMVACFLCMLIVNYEC